MAFLDDLWARFRGLPLLVQVLGWLLLFWALIPLAIWRSGLSGAWKSGLTIAFVAFLLAPGLGDSSSPPEPSSDQAIAQPDDEQEDPDTSSERAEDSETSATTDDQEQEEKSSSDTDKRPRIRGPMVLVTRVIDGDTIEVDLRGRIVDVRLIGVDTPETVHPGKPVECFGPEASNFTSSKLEGERVRLEFDVEKTDRYGRTLAYVWKGGKLFNRTLVRAGYAQVSTYPPNVKYVERFTNAQRQARNADAGLWGASCPSETAETEKTEPKAGSGGGKKNCDPNYAGACIRPYPPDLNCDDVSATNFRSVGSDPHGFDGDNDGIACES